MTISELIRRDPQKGKKEFSTRNGFTIIEMLVVLAVIAIVTSFALPSYRTLIEKRQVTSGAEQLAAFISSVQMESVKRSANVGVKYTRTDSDTWCVGMAIVTDPMTNTPCDCSITDPTAANACQIDGVLRVINDGNLNYPDIMNAMNGDGAFVYDPGRGLMVNHSDAAEIELLSVEDTYALNVQVSATGRVKMCSDSSGKKVPGYDVCS